MLHKSFEEVSQLTTAEISTWKAYFDVKEDTHNLNEIQRENWIKKLLTESEY